MRKRNKYKTLFLASSISVFILILLTLFFFSPIIINKLTFLSAGDTADFLYPNYFFIAKSFKQGFIPLWDPHIFAGMPLVAYPAYGLFYPVYWFFWLLPYPSSILPTYVYELIVIFHIFLAGLGMYILGKTLKLKENSSLIMAIGYMFAQSLTIGLGWSHQVVSYAWFPLFLAFVFKALISQNYKYSLISGFFLGILILASPAQPAIMALFLSAALFSISIIYALFKKQTFTEIFYIAQIWMTTVFIGLLIGSVSLLPILEYTPMTIRFLGEDGHIIGKTRIPAHAFARFKISLSDLQGLAIPQKSGGSMATTFNGLIPLIFLILGVFNIKKNKFKKILIPLYFTSLASIFYALGLVPLTWIYYAPIINLVREPEKFLFLHSVSIFIIMGIVFDTILQNKKIYQEIILSTLLFSLFLFTYKFLPDFFNLNFFYGSLFFLLLIFIKRYIEHNKLISMIVMGVMSILIFLDVASYQPNFFNPSKFDIDEYINSQKALSKLVPEENSFFRVSAVQDAKYWPYAITGADIVGFYDIMNYGNPVYYPLFEFRYFSNYPDRYYDLLAVKYFITHPNSEQALVVNDGENIKFIESIPDVDHIDYTKEPNNQPGEIKVYENKKVEPYAKLIDQALLITKDKDPIREVNEKIDINHQVTVQDKNDFQKITQHLAKDDHVEIESRIELADYKPNTIELSVDSSKSAILRTADLYYPGWFAFVNGKIQKTFPVNHIFRGILVSPGPNKIKFFFLPPSFLIGLFLSLSTLILSSIYIYKEKLFKISKKIDQSHIFFIIIAGLMLIMLASYYLFTRINIVPRF